MYVSYVERQQSFIKVLFDSFPESIASECHLVIRGKFAHAYTRQEGGPLHTAVRLVCAAERKTDKKNVKLRRRIS